MPRVTLTALALSGPYPTLQPAADSLDLAMTAADATNKNQVAATGKEVLVWHNTGVSSRTVTISSAPTGAHRRTGDVTAYTVAAGEYGAFGPIELEGWKQTADGMVYFEASHADVKFGILKLP